VKIAVVLASHRRTGKNKEIADMIAALHFPHTVDFIRMADENIGSCTSCCKCADAGECVCKDDFQAVLQRLINADCICIVSPVYAPIPSRLCALFERLTSFLFATGAINTDKNPLVGKSAAVFSYCSAGIVDETPIKLMMQRFLMVGYSFTEVVFPYMNQCDTPNETYGNDITSYVRDTLLTGVEARQ